MVALGMLQSHAISGRVRVRSAHVQGKTSSAALGVTFKPLHRNLGAEVVGLDVTQEFSADVRGLLKEAMQEYDMLLFRGQEMHPRDQERLLLVFPHDANAVAQRKFCSSFFQLRIPAHPLLAVRGINVKHTSDYFGIPAKELAALDVMGSPPYDKKHTWHQDLSDQPTPPEVTAMYMVKAPRVGGQTLFASAVTAYNELDTAEQAFLGALRTCSHRTAEFDMSEDGTRRIDSSELGHEEALELAQKSPPMPFVIQDPDTGKKSFLVSPQFLSHFEGLGRQESLDIVERLLKRATTKDKVYTHEWQPHDFVLWANRRVFHSGTPTNVYQHDDSRMIHIAFLDSNRPVQAAAAASPVGAAAAVAQKRPSHLLAPVLVAVLNIVGAADLQK